jgi:hypothetical protein
VEFNLSPNTSLGTAVQEIQKAEKDLGKPATLETSFQGTASEFQKSLSTQPLLIAAALFAVYIVLGILYESFIHPLTILLTLPSPTVGALVALRFFGFDLTMMAIIGLIMLIGIVKENAIMMIDFALQRERSEDKSPEASDLGGGGTAFPPDHDDNDGGSVRYPADRDRHWRRLRPASTPWRCRCRRSDRIASAYPIHDTGHLPLHGWLQRFRRSAPGAQTQSSSEGVRCIVSLTNVSCATRDE